jgi:hypothetical protein
MYKDRAWSGFLKFGASTYDFLPYSLCLQNCLSLPCLVVSCLYPLAVHHDHESSLQLGISHGQEVPRSCVCEGAGAATRCCPQPVPWNAALGEEMGRDRSATSCKCSRNGRISSMLMMAKDLNYEIAKMSLLRCRPKNKIPCSYELQTLAPAAMCTRSQRHSTKNYANAGLHLYVATWTILPFLSSQPRTLGLEACTQIYLTICAGPKHAQLAPPGDRPV